MLLINDDQARNTGFILQRPTAFQLTCDCGASGPAEIQDALAEGWRNIMESHTSSERCFGICPDCR